MTLDWLAVRSSPVFWINLDHRKDRAERMRDMLHDYGLEANSHRVEAVSRSGVPRITTEYDQDGEALHACKLSHARALSLAARSGSPFSLIFEDDASPNFAPAECAEMFDTAAGSVEEGWGLVLLGGVPVDGDGAADDRLPQTAPGLYRVAAADCCQAYLVSRSAARELSKLFAQSSRDEWHERLWSKVMYDRPSYVFYNPTLFDQTEGYSDISLVDFHARSEGGGLENVTGGHASAQVSSVKHPATGVEGMRSPSHNRRR